MGGAAVPLALGGMGLAGQLFGGGGQNTQTAIPPELMQSRMGQINLLNYLLGFGGQQGPGGQGQGQQGGGQGGGPKPYNPNQFNPFTSQFGNIAGMNTAAPGQGAQDASAFQAGGDPTQRLESFFGQLSPFERQGTGISQFLNQPSPEQRALDTSMPALQEMLTPGTMNPMLERDLAMANQQGGRFGSANAYLRAGALANQWQLRNQAANTLGMLGRGAGEGQQRQVGWADMETMRRLQLMGGLLGLNQQMVAGLPITQQPGMMQQMGQFGMGLGAMLPYLGGGGGQNLMSPVGAGSQPDLWGVPGVGGF